VVIGANMGGVEHSSLLVPHAYHMHLLAAPELQARSGCNCSVPTMYERNGALLLPTCYHSGYVRRR
jgi:hypothetical protein